jgi:glycosyltransferase involved in cell wall biosynthesis
MLARMRIAIVYDCLFPHTVGGGERAYRQIAQSLSSDHEVTYLTMRQWGDEGPGDTSFKVIAVARDRALYGTDGSRRITPTLAFGWGVFWHLLRHAGRYDVVQSISFPYFSVIGAKLALWLRRSRAPLVVDWIEAWTRDYWIEYTGAVAGRIGFVVQQLAMRLSDRVYTYSRVHERRLVDALGQERVTRLTGLFEEPVHYADAGLAPSEPHVIYAGRHIPEKNVTALPAALEELMRRRPEVTATIFGRGPDAETVSTEIERRGLGDRVSMPGFVDVEEISSAMRQASCLVLPSRREGYGLVVLEANSAGTPVVTVAGPDNAATELVDDGTNGFVATEASPEALADALEAAIDGGQELRERTFNHYRAHAEEYALSSSLEAFAQAYRAGADRDAIARS